MNNEYTYYCGSNIVVEIEGMPVLEVAGIRTTISESKRPIYGYSSRHFDAVAAGQVLVEGALLINFVDNNYLFRAIELALSRKGLGIDYSAPPALSDQELRDQLANEGNAALLFEQFAQNPRGNESISSAFKSLYWEAGPTAAGQEQVLSPHDSYPGLEIKVTFGDREPWNFYGGLTNFILDQVHFLGRGKEIRIDEAVIVEEYPFFARNQIHISNNQRLTFNSTQSAEGEVGGDSEEVSISQQDDRGFLFPPR